MKKQIRNLFILDVLVAGLVLFVACKHRSAKPEVEATDEHGQTLMSAVHVADPRAAVQLTKGFYDVEQNAWRWTMKQFSVVLRAPEGASKNGATLQMKFSVPNPVIDKLKAITLSVSVNGQALPAETYTRPGEYILKRDVPREVFHGEAVNVDFALDKAMPPSGADLRELGIVVNTVGLEPK